MEGFPRYFTRVHGFGDGTAYVEHPDPDSFVAVSFSGERTVGTGFLATLDKTMRFVAEGKWREISASEAEALVKGKQ